MIMAEGGFNLRKWVSNDQDVIKDINALEQLEGTSTKKTPMNSSTVNESKTKTKILGINWDNESDVFYHDFREIAAFAESLTVTKRLLLKNCS